jgi:hypothetical protein
MDPKLSLHCIFLLTGSPDNARCLAINLLYIFLVPSLENDSTSSN